MKILFIYFLLFITVSYQKSSEEQQECLAGIYGEQQALKNITGFGKCSDCIDHCIVMDFDDWMGYNIPCINLCECNEELKHLVTAATTPACDFSIKISMISIFALMMIFIIL